MNSATGQPIPGALVIMQAQPRLGSGGSFRPSDPQRAVTDSSGRFSFEAEDPMSVSRQVSRQGYRSEDNNGVAAVTLRAPDFDTATLRLVPQSVVTGRVLNRDGDPLYGLTVEAVRIDIVDGRREVKYNFANKVTDDRGEYRLWNLQPGSYYIKVAGRMATYNNSANTIFELSQDAFGPIYYPSATTQDTAQILRVEPGQTVSANFSTTDVLQEGLTVTAGGAPELTVRLAPGAGMLAGMIEGGAGTVQSPDIGQRWTVLLVGRRGLEPTYRTEVTFRDQFEFFSLQPGDYTLYAWPARHPLEFRNPAVLASLSQYAAFVKVGSEETKEVTLKPIPKEALP